MIRYKTENNPLFNKKPNNDIYHIIKKTDLDLIQDHYLRSFTLKRSLIVKTYKSLSAATKAEKGDLIIVIEKNMY